MTAQQQKTDKESTFDLVKIAAGAVGAMASAVLLSTLGAAGTITGAALGSVIVTVAGSMFSKGVDKSLQGVTAAQALAARRVAQARSGVGAATRDMDDSTQAQQRLSAANAELDAAESELHFQEPSTQPEGGWRDRLSVLPWKRIALAAAGVFVVSMVAITAFELFSGRAVSSMTGGSSDKERTSFSGLTGGEGSTPTPTPTPVPTSSATPSESGSSLEETPSVEPTESPTESATPSEDTSSTPTTEPEVSDTAVPEETASPTP
jgi:uncharacterized membrane protein YeaQ/YmgE (transglycosylase-associated protein family)